MANGAPSPSQYREALREARAAVQELDEQAQRQILSTLDELAEGLEGRLIGELEGLTQAELQRQAALSRSAEIVRTQYEALEQAAAQTIEGTRQASFEQVLDIWRETSRQVADSIGVDLATLGQVRGAPLQLLGVYDGIGGAANWQTLLRGHVEGAASEANRIVRGAFAEGVGPQETARRLRRYVEGAESLEDAFESTRTLTGTVEKIDLRQRIPDELQGAAQKMEFNARRIAFTEHQQARGEAEVQHFLDEPLVQAIKRSLSPNRGPHATTDVCDMLTSQDLYGLGPGVYPIGKAPPLAAHPFCKDEHNTVTRPPAQASDPKPDADPVSDVRDLSIPNGSDLTDGARDRIYTETERNLDDGLEAWERIQERRAA